jgi:hypothetical protein
MQQAMQIVQAFPSMPDSQRISYLRDLRKNNPNLHAFVKAKWDEMRSQMQSEGYLAVRQQAQTGGY